MLSNYLTLALRNLRKNPLYSGLNIFGLSLGIATCVLIALYVRDELSFDAFNEKAERIFRVNSDVHFGGMESRYAVVPPPLGGTMKRDYPQVEEFCRFRQWGMITIKKDELSLEEPLNSYVDGSIFKIFTLPFVEGDPNTALDEPNTVVITESTARKYFGTSTGVVGRTLRVNDNKDYRLTGVIRDIPAQAHFHFNVFFSMPSMGEEATSDTWLSHAFQTYLLLRPDADAAGLNALFPAMVEKYTAPQVAASMGMTYQDMTANGDYVRYNLTNIRDIHLRSDRDEEMESGGDIRYVWIFSAVALFILLLACINFMNLSTARSAGRAREVGVRKVLGSARRALVGQFLAESFVLTGVAFVLALGLASLALPYFNDFSGKEIRLFAEARAGNFWGLSDVALPLLILAVFTALLAGSYPAFILSSFRPLEVLRGNSPSLGGQGRAWLRSSLVVFQFFTSVALVICVLTVQQQLHFVQTKKLGFEKDRLVLLRNTWWLQRSTETFRQELLQMPGVESVTTSNFYPVPGMRNTGSYQPEGTTDPKSTLYADRWDLDFEYLQTLGMKLASGRDFDKNLRTDSFSVILNESAVKMLGWQNPLGRKLTIMNVDSENDPTYTVIGVVQDFHFENLRQTITPVVMHLGGWTGMMGIRLRPGDPQPALAAVGGLYNKYLPGKPFEYSFLDEDYGRQYRSELRIGKILGAFAGFAIFIACLGLFGLAAFTAEQRTKEIGIRKVLGASVAGITGLLAKDFLKLVVLAILIASPVAYYFMNLWLADFAYRIEIKWWVFALAGVGAALVAALTVSFQSVRAALANPVKSLRSE
ncbi:MAG: ABC transporter permease [Saprospiraceae bacterium]